VKKEEGMATKPAFHVHVVTVKVKRGRARHWWRLLARNRRILATSETYNRVCYARRSANLVAKALGVEVKVVDK